MSGLQLLIQFLGRICLSVFFILSAIYQILDWQGTEAALTNAISDINGYHEMGIDFLRPSLDFISVNTSLFLAIGIGLELIGGLLIFLGLNPKVGAFFLALFLIPTTLLFHHFWLLQGHEKEIQLAMFFKNISILGGVFLLLATGSSKKAPPKKEG